MSVEVRYGREGCPEDSFQVLPSCEERPGVVAPDHVLALALREDGFVRSHHAVAFLLRTAPGPNTVAKAAAVSPEGWRELLYLSMHVEDQPSSSRCACLLPFAPSTSTLAALGKSEVCLDASSLGAVFLASFVHVALSMGARRIILLNPPYLDYWERLKLSGLPGYRRALIERMPRALRVRAAVDINVDLSKNEIYEKVPFSFKLPQPRKPPSLLRFAFQEKEGLALELLREVEASGLVTSYKAFLEAARELNPGEGVAVARRLFLYGYVSIRQGQVEATEKAIYALGAGWFE
ncbi:hypothetical protein [Thermofilum pendens]|uniref:Uncharacterized protein n=1 Tax=Thermofilum pendens (strain DSM 2475 / Hrk 5) TaxID=368408 RepID=A1RYA1_THEPD|nr:hypothetical protein [Thermofilum pendens]ABL78181.1 hypothetical protein Tpen_0779 [Thermofilum pendens Hrk 5]